jgi:hypothetical protein
MEKWKEDRCLALIEWRAAARSMQVVGDLF